jgi:hypothetical protein
MHYINGGECTPARIHPTLHMSTGDPYLLVPSSSSGGLKYDCTEKKDEETYIS